MCDSTADCATTSATNSWIYTSNACDDPNGNCICNGTGCVSGSCSSDSYCQQTFGANSKCLNGFCTDNTCSTTSDCPPFMHCNGGVCISDTCNGKSDCGFWGKCSNGYCTRMVPLSGFFVFILILIAIVAAFVAYRVYVSHKK